MIFKRIKHKIFSDLIGNDVEVYIDNIIVYAKTINEHDILVREVMKKLLVNNLPNLCEK
ncbi:hypothetical protein COBT_001118, partial [Conglomerata obtusa]